MRFTDRTEAGTLLAKKISTMDIDVKNTVVIALPRGGVPVAYEIAKKLDLPLDIILIKKIGAPFNPELAVGAVTEDDEVLYNFDLLNYLGTNAEDLVPYKEHALDTLKDTQATLRHGRSSLSLTNKNIILVDDGIATGATMEAAIEFLRRRKVRNILVACPVASTEAAKKIIKLVDGVSFVLTPPHLSSISQWYVDFSQVETAKVATMLDELSRNTKAVTSPLNVMNIY